MNTSDSKKIREILLREEIAGIIAAIPKGTIGITDPEWAAKRLEQACPKADQIIDLIEPLMEAIKAMVALIVAQYPALMKSYSYQLMTEALAKTEGEKKLSCPLKDASEVTGIVPVGILHMKGDKIEYSKEIQDALYEALKSVMSMGTIVDSYEKDKAKKALAKAEDK